MQLLVYAPQPSIIANARPDVFQGCGNIQIIIEEWHFDGI
jgi:hypothetical protein